MTIKISPILLAVFKWDNDKNEDYLSSSSNLVRTCDCSDTGKKWGCVTSESSTSREYGFLLGFFLLHTYLDPWAPKKSCYPEAAMPERPFGEIANRDPQPLSSLLSFLSSGIRGNASNDRGFNHHMQKLNKTLLTGEKGRNHKGN